MEEKTEVQETHQNPEGEAPNATEIPSRVVELKSDNTVTLTKEEVEDLRKRADVSSQNYERAKKAETRLKELEDLQDNEVLSEYESDELQQLRKEVSDVKSQLSKSQLIEKHPELKEAWDEFEEFRNDPENRGMNLNTAAKAFRIEKGLAEPQRKGLERGTGGPKEPFTSTMSTEEIKKLRENDYRKYTEMLKKGQIKA